MGPEQHNKKSKTSYDGSKFDSLAEARVAHCLELYVPYWKPIPGETIQIPIGKKRIDFRVNETFLEFHPVIISRELKSDGARRMYERISKQFSPTQKNAINYLLQSELESQYWIRRNTLIQSHPNYAGCDLVVAASPMQVYKGIVQRYADTRRVQYPEFVTAWHSVRG